MSKEILKWIAATVIFLTVPIWVGPLAIGIIVFLFVYGVKSFLDEFWK